MKVAGMENSFGNGVTPNTIHWWEEGYSYLGKECFRSRQGN
jgi:hypothetical protein